MTHTQRRRSRGVDQKGRTRKDASHVRFYQVELDSLAYRSLSVGARALLVELRSLFNGTNNGKLFLSVRDAAARLNVGRHAANDWFEDLEDRGFIRPKVEAGFNWKTAARARKATCWVLTDQSTEDAAPTRDYQRWTPTAESKRLPENIRRSPPGDRVALKGDSLSPPGDSIPPSGAERGQIGAAFARNEPNLSPGGDTDSFQGESVSDEALGAAAAAGPGRDDPSSTSPHPIAVDRAPRSRP